MTESLHTTAAQPAPSSRTRRTALAVFRVLAVLTLATIAVQFVLAGLGAFGGGFDPHRTLGYVVGALAVLLLVVVLIARPSAPAIWMSALLVVLTVVVQPVLAQLGGDGDSWFGAMHALNALAVLGITGRLAVSGRPPTGRPG